VWATPTKEGRPATGFELVEYAARTATLPWFAIGGIKAVNVSEVAAAGATRVVVVRAIRDAADPEAAARTLRAALGAEARARNQPRPFPTGGGAGFLARSPSRLSR
jgi:thiamine-phosphate pyrophosphorylase